MRQDNDLERTSARVQAMKISPTIAMSGRAAGLKAKGLDVISLALGELDFNTPGRIVDAAHNAAINGMTRYTAPDGTAELKQAIQAKFLRDNGLGFALNEIHVASGCKQVIHNALAATLDAGDEVIIFAPYWVSYSDLIEFCGGKAVIVPTKPEDGFLPQRRQLAEALTSRTRWVLLNSPNNPTGAVYSAELLSQLTEVIEQHQSVLVMADEIYEHLAFDGLTHVSYLAALPHMRDRVLTVNGVSKTYAMTGWRIGYGAGPSWLIGAMAKVQSQTAGSSCSVAQEAAREALTGEQALISRWRETLESRRDRALEILRKSPWLEPHGAQGSFYVFCGVGRCIGATTPDGQILTSDIDVADYILRQANVATVAGEAFGASPFIRISFTVDIERLAEACQRIVDTLDGISSEKKPQGVGR